MSYLEMGDFGMVQVMGLQGYLPDWNARLDAPIDEQTGIS